MRRVLFVCVENAGRSQIAQAFYERRGGEARSAGTQPADEIQAAVVELLAELEIDVAERRPKRLTEEDVRWADLVVTMGCGDARPVLVNTRFSTGTSLTHEAGRSTRSASYARSFLVGSPTLYCKSSGSASTAAECDEARPIKPSPRGAS